MEINAEGSRERGRPEKRWLDAIKSDMRTAGVCVMCRLCEIMSSRGLGLRQPTTNSWDIGKGEKEDRA